MGMLNRAFRRSGGIRMASAAAVLVAPLALIGPAAPAAAELPDAATLLADLGLSPAEIAEVEAGKLVTLSLKPASERELVAGFAFATSASPAQIVSASRADLLDQVDPNMIAFAIVGGAGDADFAKLSLEPDAASRAKAYAGAAPGGDLNLSSEEIAAFQKLGSGAATAAVEAEVRAALAARIAAYRSQGLAGVAPYALGGGKSRSPADELTTAVKGSSGLQKYAPAAYQLLLSYPAGKPAGTEESFRWTHFHAHGTPTLALTHMLVIPDGDGWLISHRQFYVSTGYNAEQAMIAILPAKGGGSVVIYGNRTSTDQVAGFGGSAKRSIGSKLLASQLETLFQRGRQKVE
jgi:hypothetical protein